MWKLTLAAATTAALLAFGDQAWSLPEYYHPAVLVIPAVVIVFLAGLVHSLR